MKQFRLGYTLEGRHWWFMVKVFDSREAMYRHYRNYVSKSGPRPAQEKDEGFYRFEAIVSPYRRYWVDDDTGKITKRQHPEIGQIYFSQEFLNPMVVAHECVHAATTLFRYHYKRAPRLGRQIDQTEEDLAHIIGDLTSKLNYLFHEKGIWHPEK